MTTRKIKIKAWIKTLKVMIDLQKITPLALGEAMNTQLALLGQSGLFIPFMDDMILLQFTNQTDRTGKDIYDGDIMHHDDFPFGNNFTVEWQDEDGAWVGHGSFYEWSEKCEIIGNIYENPELVAS